MSLKVTSHIRHFIWKKRRLSFLQNLVQASRNQNIRKKTLSSFTFQGQLEPAISMKIDTNLWSKTTFSFFWKAVEIKKKIALRVPCRPTRTFKIQIWDDKDKKKRQTKKIYQRTSQKQKRQLGGFLNRYNFAYAGRDTVNKVVKVAPGVIKAATNDINEIAQGRINQIISQGDKEVKSVLPKILRGAVKDVYQTPFKLLGKFGDQQLNKIKRITLRK